MALIGNRSVLLKSPGRFLSGTVASIERNNFSTAGQIASRFQSMSPIFGGIPSGHLAPSSWSLPRTAGGMSSTNFAGAALTASGAGVGGITTTGSAAIVIGVPDAAGQLIASAVGSAALSLATNNPLLTASLNAVGSASFTLSAATATLGAEANLTGSTSMNFGGSLTPYAIGQMEGSTTDATVLTVDAIAAAVLAAALTSPIRSDVRKVNGYDVEGDGQPGTEWGPA